MNHTPREPLTPEESALAAQLPPLRGRVEPDTTLDARILAAARAGVAPAAPRPRIRWIAPMALAASLSLAVGLAWRLQPPAAPDAGAPMADAAMTDMPEARMATAPPDPVRKPQAVSPPPSNAEAAPARQRPAAVAPATVAIPPAAPPAPPPAPSAPPAAATIGVAERAAVADMVAPPADPPASSPVMAKSARATEGARERAEAATGAAPRAQANEATVAADAAVEEPQAFIGDEPGEDVPPATVESPEVRDAWLRRIEQLLREGRSEEADASLAEFRRRYPDAPLPPELRKPEP